MTDPFRSQSESVVECFSVRIVVVPAEHSGQRLDNFLLSKPKGDPAQLDLQAGAQWASQSEWWSCQGRAQIGWG